VTRKLTAKNGRLSRFLNEKTPIDDVIRELYMVTFSRPPSDEELNDARTFFESSDSPREGLEDILWALINSREFLFNH
jgi:hypothetical protein